MPRVANPPRPKHASIATPHKQSPVKIPLNDDLQEKAVRLQSRQALHDLQINQLKAAASPVRRLNNYERASSTSPKTPQEQAGRRKPHSEDGGLSVVANTAMTPMKRVPILANFEEWMKLATDNKINATNSWNFALIDYFHDMSLLKEGDGVNFQKASCTLDGCVKIYTSRVDSVATETGKLLSGLADSGNKKTKHGEENGDGEDAGEEEEGEDGVKKRQKKRAQRSSEATLATSFAQLQLKKFELEFSVDPLFKKASADFDEGGAKGLLLNHLAIDAHGKIVFDSSDDAGDATAEGEEPRRRSSGETAEETKLSEKLEVESDQNLSAGQQHQGTDIDLSVLGSKFFPNIDILDDQDLCPSLKTFDLGDSTNLMDIPFLKAPEDWRKEHDSPQKVNLGDRTGVFLDDENVPGFDEEDIGGGGFDMPINTAFGEGGEAWAREAAIEPQIRVHDGAYEEGVIEQPNDGTSVGGFDPDSGQYAVSLYHNKTQGGHEDILSYFDNALQKNWAGPEHWRIRRIKDASKPIAPAAKRKEKEPFEINFLSPLDTSTAELIYTPANSNAAISLPKTQWKSKTRNLLPDDKHFNSRQLLRLFLKPKARMGTRQPGVKSGVGNIGVKSEPELPVGEMDEAFWARKENIIATQANPEDDEIPQQGNYDANFFQDDAFPGAGGPADDDDDFADAREQFSPGIEGDPGTATQGIAGLLAGAETQQSQGAFGSQLVTQSRRLRPEYVQYARVAKKVDVRRLKEEMWKGIGFEDPPNPSEQHSAQPKSDQDTQPLKFTSVMNSLQNVYPKQAMADISTSYCFICLLHLANEKGLTLGNEAGLEELSIQKDWTAENTEGG